MSTQEDDRVNILICKGMLREGFSYNPTSWILYLQNSSETLFCQAAGRTMRLLDESKIAYIMAFNDVRAGLVFPDNENSMDKEARDRCHPNYLLNRKTQGQIQFFASNTSKPSTLESDEESDHVDLSSMASSPRLAHEAFEEDEHELFFAKRRKKIHDSTVTVSSDFADYSFLSNNTSKLDEEETQRANDYNENSMDKEARDRCHPNYPLTRKKQGQNQFFVSNTSKSPTPENDEVSDQVDLSFIASSPRLAHEAFEKNDHELFFAKRRKRAHDSTVKVSSPLAN